MNRDAETARSEALAYRQDGDDRFYCQISGTEALLGWYYTAREGTFGPFRTRDLAEAHLQDHVVSPSSQSRDRYRQLGVRFKRFWS